jgi:hypothetical protein
VSINTHGCTRQGLHVVFPFPASLDWSGQKLPLLASGLAGLGAAPRGPVTLHDLARTRFFRDGVEKNIEKGLDNFFEKGKSTSSIERLMASPAAHVGPPLEFIGHLGV